MTKVMISLSNDAPAIRLPQAELTSSASRPGIWSISSCATGAA